MNDEKFRTLALLLQRSDTLHALPANGEFTPEQLQFLLVVAAEYRQTKIVNEILTKLPEDVNCNPKGTYLKTPLHWAAEYGHLDIVNAILKRLPPKDCNSEDGFGLTALHWAAENGHLDIVKAILATLPPEDCNPTDKQGYTPLHAAAPKGHLDIVNAILAKLRPEDCNPKDKNGGTPLFWAAAKGHTKIVEAILDKLPEGADFNPKDNLGNTPLHVAAEEGWLEFIKVLFSKGADVNVKNDQGQTALLCAAEFDQTDVVNYLLAQPTVILNTPNTQGDALLHFYTGEDQSEFRKQIRQCGALEWRPRQNTAAGLVVANTAQSVHDTATEQSVNESITELSEGKTPEQITAAFKAFRKYIDKSDDFVKDIEEISKESFGEGVLGTYTTAATPGQRETLLMKAIRGDDNNTGYVARMMNSSSSTGTKFQKVAGLVWLAIKDSKHLEAIKALGHNPTPEKIDDELKAIRHNLWKRILSIQYEYLQPGQSVEESHPACGPGTINHHLAILNGIHDQVIVSNQPISKPFAGLQDPLSEQGYPDLNALIESAFKNKENLLQSIIEGLADIPACTQAIYSSFLANTNEAPRTVELQLALEKFIGALKTVFTPENEEDYLQLEDALRIMSYAELTQTLTNLNRQLNPSSCPTSASLPVPTDPREKAIAILHAYVDSEISKMAQQIEISSRDNKGQALPNSVHNIENLRLRKAALELKKQSLPQATGSAPEGVLAENLRNLLQEEGNAALVNDPLFKEFRKETVLSDFLEQPEMLSRPASPGVTPGYKPRGGMATFGQTTKAQMREARLKRFDSHG